MKKRNTKPNIYQDLPIWLWSLLLIGIVVFSVPVLGSSQNRLGGTSQVTSSAKEIKEENLKQRYNMSVAYPQINGLKDLQYQTQINQQIIKWLTDQIDQFKISALQSASFRALQDAKSELAIEYKVVHADESIISIEFDKNEYFLGMAHPASTTKGMNYSVKDKKELKLSDIFKPNTNYLQQLSDISANELRKGLQQDQGTVDEDILRQGTLPKEENFQTFLLDKKNLILVFDPALVAAYVAGVRKVAIPFTKLQGFSLK